MKTVSVRLDLGLPRFGAVALFGLAALALGSNDLASESVTLTTYYPAPSAVYTKILDQGTSWLARDSGAVVIGSAGTPASANTKLQVDGAGAIFSGRMNIGTNTDQGPVLYVNGPAAAGSSALRVANGGASLTFPYNGHQMINGAPGLQFQMGATTVMGVGAGTGGNVNFSGGVMSVNGSVTIRENGCSNVQYAEGTQSCPGNGYVSYTAGVIQCGNLADAFPGNGGVYSNYGTMTCCPWPAVPSGGWINGGSPCGGY